MECEKDKENVCFKSEPGFKKDYAIIGGPDACPVTPHSKPWAVALVYNTHTTIAACGGTLISQNIVLTAAHCICQCVLEVKGACVTMAVSPNCISWRNFIAVVGEHDLKVNDGYDEAITITNGDVHKKWKGTKIFNI